MSGRCRCRFPEGIVIKPDGINRLDPCVYVQKEMHTNVTVIVSQCKNCGHISLEWHRTDEPEDFIDEPLDDEPDDD